MSILLLLTISCVSTKIITIENVESVSFKDVKTLEEYVTKLELQLQKAMENRAVIIKQVESADGFRVKVIFVE